MCVCVCECVSSSFFLLFFFFSFFLFLSVRRKIPALIKILKKKKKKTNKINQSDTCMAPHRTIVILTQNILIHALKIA